MEMNTLPTVEDPTKIKADDDSGDDSDSTAKPARRSGRRKIKIEYIEDKNRRHITFSKRKAGIMKKVPISRVYFYFFFFFLLNNVF
jgi:MADS-box transcription factor/pheromone receptor transcription factor